MSINSLAIRSQVLRFQSIPWQKCPIPQIWKDRERERRKGAVGLRLGFDWRRICRTYSERFRRQGRQQRIVLPFSLSGQGLLLLCAPGANSTYVYVSDELSNDVHVQVCDDANDRVLHLRIRRSTTFVSCPGPIDPSGCLTGWRTEYDDCAESAELSLRPSTSRNDFISAIIMYLVPVCWTVTSQWCCWIGASLVLGEICFQPIAWR